MADQQPDSNVIPLASSSNGRASGKPWKALKKATGAHKAKWEERMEQHKKEKAVKKLENELKEERRAELQRSVVFQRRRREMSARKAARLRRKAGRSKKIKG
ncbi:hypothetical protein BKA83DRAFT_4202862 [Pisolithus microcarpus]|nr:hypothetical protein BKA83DRAFT_4202862 [Pisolithus microcarpus]